MIVIVTASRTWNDPTPIIRRLNTAWAAAVADGGGRLYVMHGDCPRGGDRLARVWCGCRFPGVEHLPRPAYWEQHDGSCGTGRPAPYNPTGRPCQGPPGRKCGNAGFRRNAEMVQEAVALADRLQVPAVCEAFIRAGSSGATHCAGLAEKAGLVVWREPWMGLPDKM